ncbi:dynein regulatory complex protein 1 [Halyomorpha halys]|uniref:dynein regulatory complex protein 1 n=1 Tax=Halyomorpha halys TaxID=286706 RepID=UPI0006D50A78|nr:dynein regulatory complex protein 1 [Halyomorpha halys]
MKTKFKARRKRLPARLKKIDELLPSYGKFKKELDRTYDLCKKIPSERSLQVSSNGPDIPLPQNIDDAILNILCTHPKEMKYAWDVLMKYQQEELNEKNKVDEGTIKEESPLCKEMQEGLLDLHDLIIDGTDSVLNVKHAAVKKELARVQQENKYREELEKAVLDDNEEAEKELEAIRAGWDGIKKLTNPLEIDRGTNFLKGKCEQLLRSKDNMINYLKDELKNKDEKFVNELEKQGLEIDILIDRVEEQISVLKNAYSLQLEKLQEMIDTEKEDIIINNRKIWEALIKERDDIDQAAVNMVYQLIEEHEVKMDMDNIEQNEKQRVLDYELNSIIHKMTLELDRLRSMCTLNIEKISYNYQLLLKRQSSNQMIKNENKRRILQLKHEIDVLKNKIKMGTKSLAKEINDHASAIDVLQRNIRELEERSTNLASANSKKYFALWDFNQKRAEDILHQIFAGDKVLFEQVLYVPWIGPTEISFPKEVMPSYSEGLRITAIAKKRRLAKRLPDEDIKEDAESMNLVKLIIKKLPTAFTFFLDMHMKKQIVKFSNEDKALVELDAIFNALSVDNKKDMIRLAKYFEKYITCPDCLGPDFRTKMNNKMSQTEDLNTFLNEEEADQEIAHDEKENPETEKMCILTEHIRHHLKIVTDTVYKEVHHSDYEPQLGQALEDKINQRPEEIDHVEIKEEDMIEKHRLFGMTSKEYPIDWYVANLNESCFDETLDDKKGTVNEVPIIRDPEAVVKFCNDPSHKPYINPIDIAKAIKEFTMDRFEINKMKTTRSLDDLQMKMKVTLSRFVDQKDVEDYWNSFLEIISKEKLDLWDTMHIAMQAYYKALQKRHELNIEIKKLKKSNYELRRLLQRYIETSKSHDDRYGVYFKDIQSNLCVDNESTSTKELY